MAKSIIVCFRKQFNIDFSQFINVMFSRIKPDNAFVHEPYIYEQDRLMTCVFNPPLYFNCDNGSFYLGLIAKDAKDIFIPQAPQPDGTFALFRSNKRYVEILTDYTASRTIWYYYCRDVLVVSTSQRLIISFLGNFMFHRLAASWMLLSGTLGPGASWDYRIKSLPSNSTLLLDRTQWQISIETSTFFDFSSKISKTVSEYHQYIEDSVAQSVSAVPDFQLLVP